MSHYHVVLAWLIEYFGLDVVNGSCPVKFGEKELLDKVSS